MRALFALSLLMAAPAACAAPQAQMSPIRGAGGAIEPLMEIERQDSSDVLVFVPLMAWRIGLLKLAVSEPDAAAQAREVLDEEAIGWQEALWAAFAPALRQALTDRLQPYELTELAAFHQRPDVVRHRSVARAMGEWGKRPVEEMSEQERVRIGAALAWAAENEPRHPLLGKYREAVAEALKSTFASAAFCEGERGFHERVRRRLSPAVFQAIARPGVCARAIASPQQKP